MSSFSHSIRYGVFMAHTVMLAACAPMSIKPDGAPVIKPSVSAVPAVSPEAQTILAQAERDVQVARERFALWNTAEAALKLAWDAAHAGDSATVIKQARRASDQAKAGLVQLGYPGTELK